MAGCLRQWETEFRDQVAGHEARAVPVMPEENAALEPPHHDVVEGPGSVEARMSSHT